VADCRFEDVAYGVHAMLGGDGIEGPAPRDLEIRRCAFARPWIAGVALSVKAFGVVPPDVGGARLADCAFELAGKGRAVSGRLPDVALTNLTLRGEGTGGAAVQVKTRAAAEAQAVSACLARLRACQLPDGAFAQVEPRGAGAPVWVAPYFAHFAALALLAGHAREPSPEDVARVGRWLDWCAAHQAADGYWNDFEGTAASYTDTGKVDAWDSSAALFLLAADRHRRAGGALTPAARAAREHNVLAEGRRFADASSERTPLNPDWDRAFLDALEAGKLDALRQLADADITRAAGAGGHEVRTWLAAAAALAAAGPYRARRLYYRPIDPWIAGFGVVTALPA
jgi:hypothetical protein